MSSTTLKTFWIATYMCKPKRNIFSCSTAPFRLDFHLFYVICITLHLHFCILGAYSPLVTEGKVLVDGVLASCYASFPDHDMAHLTMAPMRWFPKVMHLIFGEDTEVPVYVKVTEYFGRSISPNTIL